MESDSLTAHSARAGAAFLAFLLIPACAAGPRLGTDEGRAAVVWQSEARERSETPGRQTEKDAERDLLAAARAAERNGSENLALADTLYRLAILRRQQGDTADAAQLYRRALEIREREQGPNHPDVALVLNNLAVLEAGQGNYAAAQPLLERALNIRQAAFGADHVLTAQSLSNLGLLDAARGDASAAERLYQRAIAILEKTDAPDKGELDRVLDNYAALLRDTGRDAEAEALEARARVVRAANGTPPDRTR